MYFSFKVINNQAKHEALLANLKLIKQLGVERQKVFTNSRLVTNQVTDKYEAWNSMMASSWTKYRL